MDDRLRKRNRAIFVCFASLVVLAVTGIYLASACFGELFGYRASRQGMLDAARTDFPTRGSTLLYGEWEVYYGKLIGTYNLANETPDDVVSVPGGWTSAKQVRRYNETGMASYRMLVTNLVPGQALKCDALGMLGDYQVFLNGRPVTHSSERGGLLRTSQVNASLCVEVIVEVRNSVRGGLCGTLLLARADTFDAIVSRRGNVAVFFAGIILFALIEFFIVFVFGKKDRINRHIIIAGLIAMLRYLASTLVVLPMLETLPWLLKRQEMALGYLILTILSIVPGVYLLDALFPGAADQTKKRICFGCASAAALIAALSWGSVYYFYARVPILILAGLAFGYLTVVLFRLMRNGRGDLLACAIGVALIVFGIAVDTLYVGGYIIFDMAFVLPGCMLGAVLMFAMMLSKRERINYEAGLRTAKLQVQLADTQTALFAKQIHPHFLYNTLTAIQELCYTDPVAAADAIARFASYLRGNIDFLGNEKLIPFSKELDHIMNYVAIMQMRFGTRLKFTTRIETMDFQLPMLTVQPLISNSIKHGMEKTLAKGEICLKVHETQNEIIIVVEDNGAGFNVEEIEKNNRFRGIENVRTRLWNWLFATLAFESEIGCGTRATITIPKKGEHHENHIGG